jgi:hypothetical protein
MDEKQRAAMQRRMLSTWLQAVKLDGQIAELLTKYPALKRHGSFMDLASAAATLKEDLRDYEEYVRDAVDEDWMRESELLGIE